MIAAEIIGQVLDAGGQITVDGADLVLTAPQPLPPELLDSLKAHKHAIMAALARPDPPPPFRRGLGGYATPPGVPPLGDCALARQVRSMPEGDPELAVRLSASDPAVLWWRISILEPGGRTIEVDTPSGWTLADWQAYAARYHPPGCAVTPIARLPEARGPVNLDEAIRAACAGVGISPAQFRALLSPEDIEDIAAGGIHPKTLEAYARAFAEGMRSGRIAALPERKEAKPVPFGGTIVITDAELEAARKGRLVVKQGTFTGAPEVKG